MFSIKNVSLCHISISTKNSRHPLQRHTVHQVCVNVDPQLKDYSQHKTRWRKEQSRNVNILRNLAGASRKQDTPAFLQFYFSKFFNLYYTFFNTNLFSIKTYKFSIELNLECFQLNLGTWNRILFIVARK